MRIGIETSCSPDELCEIRERIIERMFVVCQSAHGLDVFQVPRRELRAMFPRQFKVLERLAAQYRAIV